MTRLLVVLVVAFFWNMAAAQSWPVKPVRIIAPFAPGGSADTLGRIVAQKLTESVKETFIVENRPGAGGYLAWNHVASADPDGYTLLLSADSVPERAREPYTIAARIPGLFDALFCHCDCHERDGRRSLLECFEDDMASTCGICQGQATMAGELHAQGKSLQEIRAAIDQRWGS